MTGNTFAQFASSSVESAAAGTAVTLQRDGIIVVARYQGLSAATGFAGFGRWSTTADGTVVAGVVFYDAGVDRTAIVSVRRALHIHEMGHALGYSHVTNRQSVMNPSPAIDPNDFDRDATRVAFARSPGSVSPDVDATTVLANPAFLPASFAGESISSPGAIWGPAIP